MTDSKFKLNKEEIIDIIYDILEANHLNHTNLLALKSVMLAVNWDNYDLFCDLTVRYVTDFNANKVFPIGRSIKRSTGEDVDLDDIHFPLLFYLYSAHLSFINCKAKKQYNLAYNNRYFDFLLSRGASPFTTMARYDKLTPPINLLTYICMPPEMNEEVCDNFTNHLLPMMIHYGVDINWKDHKGRSVLTYLLFKHCSAGESKSFVVFAKPQPFTMQRVLVAKIIIVLLKINVAETNDKEEQWLLDNSFMLANRREDSLEEDVDVAEGVLQACTDYEMRLKTFCELNKVSFYKALCFDCILL